MYSHIQLYYPHIIVCMNEIGLKWGKPQFENLN